MQIWDTGLLDVAFPVHGEDFVVTLFLESVVPEEVPGRDARGTEEVVFFPIAMIGAAGFKDCWDIVLLWEGWVECRVFLIVEGGRTVLILAV